ncbi:MAG: SAM-dependent methyltransferase, partial [Polyangiales bacterium]
MSSAPDPSKYTTVGHRDLDILNPVSSPKLDAAIEALELSRSSRALDLGCGKGALVARIERKFSCESIGVDRSPALVDAARNPNVKVGDAKEFLAHGGLWDAIACVGSSHIFGDAASTLAAIVPHLAPNGRVLLGEGYWRREPAPEYLASFGGTRDELLPLGGLVALGARHDLVPTHVAAASEGAPHGRCLCQRPQIAVELRLAVAAVADGIEHLDRARDVGDVAGRDHERGQPPPEPRARR